MDSQLLKSLSLIKRFILITRPITRPITRAITRSITGGGSAPSVGPDYISTQKISSPRLFGAPSTSLGITAPAETDGVIIVSLVQKKSSGFSPTTIAVDGGLVVGAMDSVNSNPSGRENQMSVFEVKSFTPGSHSIQVDNLDGFEGATIVAVYYKDYTELTGVFSKDQATGIQPQQLTLGNAAWAVTPGNIGLNICFAGGLNALVSQVASAEYNGLSNAYSTTDTNDDTYNGTLQTATNDSLGSNSDAQWVVDWSSATDAEVMVLSGELKNT